MLSKYHYDITKQLLLWSGYSKQDAETIAYACNFTDENRTNYDINGYRNKRSQTYDILDKERSDIYFCFHYIPGNNEKPAGRKDGKENKYSVIADSKIANKILDEALRTEDLNRIGIALHAYSDTFAHQGFSGQFDSWNDSVLSTMPVVGHMDEFNWPDDNLHWNDRRYEDHLIHNGKRWIECCFMILEKLGEDMNSSTWTYPILDIVFSNEPSKFVNKWDTKEKIEKDFHNWKAFQDAVKKHKNYCLQLFKDNGL